MARGSITRNVAAVYTAAAPRQLEAGSAWYARARDACATIASEYGYPLATVAGVTSALSPRVPWDKNLEDARALIEAHARGINADSVRVNGYRSNVRKAYTIASERPSTLDEVTSYFSWRTGPKTLSFTVNILCGSSLGGRYVTIDGHAYHAALLGLRRRAITAASSRLTPAQYRAVMSTYARVAERVGKDAAIVQAVVWLVYRSLTLGRGKGKE